MAVDSKHIQYTKRAGAWDRCRDVLEGEEAVKAKTSAYVPMLSGMSTSDYASYIARALFYNATARTRSGLVGGIFRKPPNIADWPEDREEDRKNITLTGLSFEAFAKSVVDEQLGVGRCGVITDMPPVPEGSPVNPNARPYLRLYQAENIINWGVEYLTGVPRLYFVALKECVYEAGDDQYDLAEVEQIRMLMMIEGQYTQQLYRKQKAAEGQKEDWAPFGNPIIPTRRGKAFDFIPFQFFGPSTLDVDVEKPPLLDLVDVNLSHYRTSADLEHGAHFTALPTPWVSGLTDQTQTMRIGAGTAWVLPKDGAAGMLEYKGEGLKALESQLERKEKYMAVLGARLLEDQKSGVEAADTVRMRHSGENSVLASIADTAGRGLTNCLTWYLQWLGIEKPPVVALNKEFMSSGMTSQELTALVSSWQQGAIGGEALFFNLKQGERLPDDMTLEDWKDDIEENGSTALLGMPGAGNPDDQGGDQTNPADNAGAA